MKITTLQYISKEKTEMQRMKNLCTSVFPCAKRFFSILAMLSFSFISCEEAYDDFPRTEVRFTCSLQQSPYSFITTPGQFLTITKDGSAYVVEYPGQPAYKDGKLGIFLGYGGLILGQPILSMEVNNAYIAYDRACPVEAEELSIRRLNINTNREAKCPKCGTVYDLDTGFPKSGKGRKRLKTYNIYTTNTTTGFSLTVRN